MASSKPPIELYLLKKSLKSSIILFRERKCNIRTNLEIGLIGETSDFILLKDIDWKLVKTKDQLFKFIEKINLDPDVYLEIKKYITKAPEGSLNYIAKNFRFLIETCVEKVLTNKNLNNIIETPIETIPEIKPIKQVKLPHKQPVVENITSGIEIEVPKQEKKPKWVTMSSAEAMSQFEEKKPVPKEKVKSFEEITQEVETEIDKFLNDEEFMNKLKDKSRGE